MSKQYNNNEVKYAGFWVRVLATVIDGLILYIPITIIEKIFGEESWITIILIAILWWQYTALMLSSSWKATLGKKVLGLEVLTTDFERLTFKKASVRFLYSLISYFFILPVFMMFFNNKKQTFHDYFAKTVLIDSVAINATRVEAYEDNTDNIPKKENKSYKISKAIRIIGIIIITPVILYALYLFAAFALVYGLLYTNKTKEYNNSFQTNYTTNDYNDSRIIFYKKELQEYSKDFIEAESMYNIFEADVKKDLALNCIEYFLREHNETNWIDQGSNFRKNARNKYANTDEKIEKAKENEDYMGKHFYDYDLNDVNHIEDEIADVWGENTNKDTCQKNLSSEKMYEMFIVKYIKNRQEALERDILESKSVKKGDFPNKEFYIKEIEQTKEWLDILYKEYPDFFESIKK